MFVYDLIDIILIKTIKALIFTALYETSRFSLLNCWSKTTLQYRFDLIFNWLKFCFIYVFGKDDEF